VKNIANKFLIKTSLKPKNYDLELAIEGDLSPGRSGDIIRNSSFFFNLNEPFELFPIFACREID